MIKAIFIVWIGSGQILSMIPFDSVGDCESAKKAMVAFHDRFEGDCVPYVSTP